MSYTFTKKDTHHREARCAHCDQPIVYDELFTTWPWCDEHDDRCDCGELERPGTVLNGHAGCHMLWQHMGGDRFTIGTIADDLLEHVRDGTIGDSLNVLGDIAAELVPEGLPLPSGAARVIGLVADALLAEWRDEVLR